MSALGAFAKEEYVLSVAISLAIVEPFQVVGTISAVPVLTPVLGDNMRHRSRTVLMLISPYFAPRDKGPHLSRNTRSVK